ncbi:hypothetical protein C8R46DRAFT_1033135 [Mycena filopes]|nr:hypothetical protein C8R46DRAFT_1033135 [Mycena filopes]
MFKKHTEENLMGNRGFTRLPVEVSGHETAVQSVQASWKGTETYRCFYNQRMVEAGGLEMGLSDLGSKPRPAGRRSTREKDQALREFTVQGKVEVKEGNKTSRPRPKGKPLFPPLSICDPLLLLHFEMGRNRSNQSSQSAKRTLANHRYYEAHPELRAKNKARIAERRRQWDPPRKSPLHQEEDGFDTISDLSLGRAPMVATEAAAEAALTAMYHLRIAEADARNPPEPRGLAEIAAYSSSEESAKIMRQAQLEAERAERMRIIVESSRSWEEVAAIHKERGSVEVDRWLRGLVVEDAMFPL